MTEYEKEELERLKTYPYNRVYDFPTFKGIEDLPRQIMLYLLDMPSQGYTPTDNNELPRCRLMKYLYYDGSEVLSQQLPTPAQKWALVFNPQAADTPPSEKGYRIFAQAYTGQAQPEAQTVLRIYMGRTIATGPLTAELAICFEILTANTYETNTIALSRAFAMEQCILEAMNGVNIGNGTLGAFYFNRSKHGDCGSFPISDKGNNVGRLLTMAIQWGAEK